MGGVGGGGENCPRGKRKQQYKKGSISFSFALKTRETYRVHSHVAIAPHLGHVIVNTVTCFYSCGLATGMNAVILICFCTMFWLRKSECYKSFESKFSGGGGGARFQDLSFELIPMPVNPTKCIPSNRSGLFLHLVNAWSLSSYMKGGYFALNTHFSAYL